MCSAQITGYLLSDAEYISGDTSEFSPKLVKGIAGIMRSWEAGYQHADEVVEISATPLAELDIPSAAK